MGPGLHMVSHPSQISLESSAVLSHSENVAGKCNPAGTVFSTKCIYYCKWITSIHPLSIRLILNRVMGVLEPLPAGIGRAAGYTLDRLPVSQSLAMRRRIFRQSQSADVVRQLFNVSYLIHAQHHRLIDRLTNNSKSRSNKCSMQPLWRASTAWYCNCLNHRNVLLM